MASLGGIIDIRSSWPFIRRNERHESVARIRCLRQTQSFWRMEQIERSLNRLRPRDDVSCPTFLILENTMTRLLCSSVFAALILCGSAHASALYTPGDSIPSTVSQPPLFFEICVFRLATMPRRLAQMYSVSTRPSLPFGLILTTEVIQIACAFKAL